MLCLMTLCLPHVLWCEEYELFVGLFSGMFQHQLHADTTIQHILMWEEL